MRFGYALSRLLGSVYGNGNVVFLPPEGTCILSPVRNRVVSKLVLRYPFVRCTAVQMQYCRA